VEALVAAGIPDWQADGLIEDYAHYLRGEASEVATGFRRRRASHHVRLMLCPGLRSRFLKMRKLDDSRHRPRDSVGVKGAAVGAIAIGAFSVGALAVGVIAIGRLAIGRLIAERVKFIRYRLRN